MPYLLAGRHTHCSGSPPKPVKVFTLPFAIPSPSMVRAGTRIMSAHRSLRCRNRASIRNQPLRLKETKRMERAKLANAKKTQSVNTKSARVSLKKTGRKPKAEACVPLLRERRLGAELHQATRSPLPEV